MVILARRLAAAAALAVTATVGAAGAAHADCLNPPEPVFRDEAGWASGVDPGPTDRTIGSTYAQFGWAGYAFPMYEDQNCVAGHVVGPRGRPDMSTRSARAAVSTGTLIAATAPSAARAAFSEDGLLGVVKRLVAPIGVVFSPVVLWLLWSCAQAGLVAWGSWARTYADRHREVRRAYLASMMVVSAALACIMWSAAIPRAQTQVITTSLAAVQTAATGATGTADVAIGNAVTDYLMMPAWGWALLRDWDAVDKYAWRLRAATVFSASEEAEIRAQRAKGGNPVAYTASLWERKNADYRAVAAEMKTTHPAAYRRLAGHNTDGRGSEMWLGVLAAGAACAVLVAALVVVLIARTLCPVLVTVFPSMSWLVQLPRLQWIGPFILSRLLRWTFAGCVACVVFVLWMIGPIAGLVSSTSESIWTRLGAFGLIYGALWLLWRSRKDIVRRFRQRVVDGRAELTLQEAVTAVAERVADAAHLHRAERSDGTGAQAVEAAPPEAGEAGEDEVESPSMRERYTAWVAHLRGPKPPVDEPEAEPTDGDAPVDDPQERDRFDRNLRIVRAEAEFDAMESDELARRRAQQEQPKQTESEQEEQHVHLTQASAGDDR